MMKFYPPPHGRCEYLHAWVLKEVGREIWTNSTYTNKNGDTVKVQGTRDTYFCKHCKTERVFDEEDMQEILSPPKLNKTNVDIVFLVEGNPNHPIGEMPEEGTKNVTMSFHCIVELRFIFGRREYKHFKATITIDVFDDRLVDLFLRDFERALFNEGVNSQYAIVDGWTKQMKKGKVKS